jgi:hypothetical protein
MSLHAASRIQEPSECTMARVEAKAYRDNREEAA